MVILTKVKSEYGEIDKIKDTKMSDISTATKVTAGLSVVGLGLAFMVIGFPTLRNIATTVAASWTTYKMVKELEEKKT